MWKITNAITVDPPEHDTKPIFAVHSVLKSILFLLLRASSQSVMTSKMLLVMLLPLFGLALSHEDLVGDKEPLWSSLTPLQIAAMEGRVEQVEDILLRKEEAANSSVGDSALQWAALRGNVPIIRVLLRFGANASALDDDGNTALHMAALSGSPGAVQELVLAEVDINKRNGKNVTAVHLAVGKQDFEVVKQLLRFGALTNTTDQEGRSPLDLAVETNNLSIIALLRASGAKKIKYLSESYGKANTTPSTRIATTTTKPPKIQLPKATRRPEVRKLTEKEKRMHEAAKKSLDDIIADLCAEGVDPNVADIDNNGYTPLHLAAANNGKVALLALARCSANLNVKDFDGNTPLHIAVIKDFPWSADMLLMLGAASDLKNNEGKSPKDLVTPGKNQGFQATFIPQRVKWISNVRTLSDRERNLLRLVENGYYLSIADSCEQGVDVRVKDAEHKQYTMLHYAVSIKNNIPGTIQMLVRCGADLNARDVDGNTPMHIAATGKFNDALRVLLLNGADLFVANRSGKTVHQILKESSPEAIDNRLEWYMNSMPV